MARALRWLALPLLATVALLWPTRATEGELPPARHETSDVAFRPMLYAGFAMLAAVAAILGFAYWLFPGAMQDKMLQRPLPQFPSPQLQPDTAADMAVFRARQLRQLNTAYWLDAEHRTVHLPIAQAMQDIARTGIPDWPAR